MKKNFFKALFAVAAIVTVGLGSYKAYGSYIAANMSEEDLLLAENVLALSDGTPKYIKVKAYKGWSEDSNFPDGGRVYESAYKCYPITNAWVFDETDCWIKK